MEADVTCVTCTDPMSDRLELLHPGAVTLESGSGIISLGFQPAGHGKRRSSRPLCSVMIFCPWSFGNGWQSSQSLPDDAFHLSLLMSAHLCLPAVPETGESPAWLLPPVIFEPDSEIF